MLNMLLLLKTKKKDLSHCYNLVFKIKKYKFKTMHSTLARLLKTQNLEKDS